MLESEKHARGKNMKCYAYIIAGVVLQSIIILVFGLVFLRVKTPDIELRSVTVENFNHDNTTFRMNLIAEIAIKNKNYGQFKFDNSTANVTYGGVTVGGGQILKGRAKARRTRSMTITMAVTQEKTLDIMNLGSDLNSGKLILRSYAKLSGKVHLIKVMKKRKTAEMNCTMTYVLESNQIQGLDCE